VEQPLPGEVGTVLQPRVRQVGAGDRGIAQYRLRFRIIECGQPGARECEQLRIVRLLGDAPLEVLVCDPGPVQLPIRDAEPAEQVWVVRRIAQTSLEQLGHLLEAALVTQAERVLQEGVDVAHAPNFARRPACASISVIRSFAGKIPSSPRAHARSPNTAPGSGRTHWDTIITGTGCHE